MIAFLHTLPCSTSYKPLNIRQRLRRNLHKIWGKTPFYHFILTRTLPSKPHCAPASAWPGSSILGHKILQGKFIIHEQPLNVAKVWALSPTLPSKEMCSLHTFEWLYDLRAVGDNAARKAARQIMTDWWAHPQPWRSIAWRADVVAIRLMNWLSLYDFFGASADDAFRKRYFQSCLRQTQHLMRTWQDLCCSTQQTFAVSGLIMALIMLQVETERLPSLLQAFENLIRTQLLRDGGHITRNPVIQLYLMRVLIDLRQVLRQVALEIPRPLQEAIHRMAPLLRLFRHGDGTIATFDGDTIISASLVDMILSLSDVRGKPPTQAPLMGFERLTGRHALLLSSSHSVHKIAGDDTTVFPGIEWSTAKHALIRLSDICIDWKGPSLKIPEHLASSTMEPLNTPEGRILHSQYEAHHNQTHAHLFRTYFMSHEMLDLRVEEVWHASQDGQFAIRLILAPEWEASSVQQRILLKNKNFPATYTFASSCPKQTMIDHSQHYPMQTMIVILAPFKAAQELSIRWSITQS